mmetsp:Transcript_116843/g.371926  ORF Transcript_116843/g.371926 Transcript_116843/m.371926 type:complete len:224 (+) Transcript_116843:1739-2410(+)
MLSATTMAPVHTPMRLETKIICNSSMTSGSSASSANALGSLMATLGPSFSTFAKAPNSSKARFGTSHSMISFASSAKAPDSSRATFGSACGALACRRSSAAPLRLVTPRLQRAAWRANRRRADLPTNREQLQRRNNTDVATPNAPRPEGFLHRPPAADELRVCSTGSRLPTLPGRRPNRAVACCPLCLAGSLATNPGGGRDDGRGACNAARARGGSMAVGNKG